MPFTQRPQTTVWVPLGNNIIFEYNATGLVYMDVTINDVHSLRFYAFGGKVKFNLKDALQKILLEHDNIVKNVPNTKIVCVARNLTNTPISTDTFNYKFLPFGVDYDSTVGLTYAPISNGFLATPRKVVDFYRAADGMSVFRKYNSSGVLVFPDEIEVIQSDKCGIFLQWVNDLAGYSQWVFSPINTSVTHESLDEINNDYNSFEFTTSPTYLLGKETRRKIQVTSDPLSDWEIEIVKSIFKSPDVKMYVPVDERMLTVQIADGSNVILNHKNGKAEIMLTIILPYDNNIKL